MLIGKSVRQEEALLPALLRIEGAHVEALPQELTLRTWPAIALRSATSRCEMMPPGVQCREMAEVLPLFCLAGARGARYFNVSAGRLVCPLTLVIL